METSGRSESSRIYNPNYQLWINNDGTTWLLGTMTVDMLSFTFGLDTAFNVWHTIEEHLLPATKEKGIYLTNCLMGLKKGSAPLEGILKPSI